MKYIWKVDFQRIFERRSTIFYLKNVLKIFPFDKIKTFFMPFSCYFLIF